MRSTSIGFASTSGQLPFVSLGAEPGSAEWQAQQATAFYQQQIAEEQRLRQMAQNYNPQPGGGAAQTVRDVIDVLSTAGAAAGNIYQGFQPKPKPTNWLLVGGIAAAAIGGLLLARRMF